MFLSPIIAFANNHLQLLHGGKRAMVVDPDDTGPVKGALEQHPPLSESILVTHHPADHADHAAGSPGLPGSGTRNLAVKPFFQTRQAAIMASTRRRGAPAHDDITALAAIRQ